MERLARPLTELEPRYDVIVVGSGYGGAIAACRLSRAGRSVALFERGREVHPGEYPNTLTEAAAEVQVSGPVLGLAAHAGDRRNLYWFHTDGPMRVFSGCGLGGTSLVNAGVSLTPEARVLSDPRWPTALRGDVDGSLERGFEAARRMLEPYAYPETSPRLAKVDALRSAADGRPVSLAPVNITFEAGPNAAGVDQAACTGCGDCVTGCNVGAKNTVLMNYLPDAAAHGAHLFTELEVRTVEPTDGGQRWIVHAQPLGLGRNKEFHAPPLAITADTVVLAAGTLGTTEILLRSRDAGLRVSARLGHGFTGNGDVLGFAERPGVLVHGVGAGRHLPDATAPPGPCISAYTTRDASSGDGRAVIEDAVIPGLLAEVVAAALTTHIGQERQPHLRTGGLGALARMFTRQGGRTEHLQTFLVMGQDDGQGRLVLDDDHIRVEWSGVGNSPYYQQAAAELAGVAERAGGTFIKDPLSSDLLHDSLVTVHPLGGCAMADRADHGVVDHRGRVFSSDDDDEVYPDLLVADGSIVPLPLGVNPLLTISALAERQMALLCAEREWAVDSAPPISPRTPSPPPPSMVPGLRFTERMAGWWTEDARPDGGALAAFLSGEEQGRRLGNGSVSFVLTLCSQDIRAVMEDLATPMDVVGTVVIPTLSPEPLGVEHGQFQLLVADDPDPDVLHMRYRLSLAAVTGERYFLDGFKIVAPGVIGEVWEATSTLYATLRRGGSDGEVLGHGVLRIAPRDLVRQLRTLEVVGPGERVDRLEIEARFLRAFVGPLADDYGTAIHRATPFRADAPARRRRPLDVPPGRRYEYRTPDGLSLRLTRYRGGGSAPVVLSHGMGNPLTWSLDTSDPTLLEVLVANGYDVWLQEWRSSTLLPSAQTQFDADQVASMDHPSAAAVVAAESGRRDLHLITHCVGSLTWLMATLNGSVAPDSLLCSALGVHPVAPTLTRLKVGFRLGQTLHRMGVQVLTTDSSTDESSAERAFDRLLRFYPIPKEERCDQAVCRRVAFIYGNAVHHAQLNPATHAALHELFGPANLTMLDHLSLMAVEEEARSARGDDTYLVHLDRLRRPITFLHGDANLVWLPESTRRTFNRLVSEFGAGDYRRTVVPNYGHQDLLNGAHAARDVFPSILDHLRWVNA